jgi:glucose/arabinose dehydrogenase
MFGRVRIGSLVVSLGLVVSSASSVLANHGGIPGFSGIPTANGGQICNLCHTGGVAPTVMLSGPTLVDAGTTYSYSLDISGGQQFGCGFGAAATDGELTAVEAGTELFDDDSTHSAPRPVDMTGACTFVFDWTAPYQVDQVTLYGSGNSVNGNDQTTGDAAASDSILITVTQPAAGEFPPVAISKGPYSVTIGESIQFDGADSEDPDGGMVSWDWDFGDSNTGVGAEPMHSYTVPGTYTVTLAVTDDTGRTDMDTTTARVRLPGGFEVERFVRSNLLRRAVFVTAPPGDDRLFVVIQGIGETPEMGRIMIVEADGQVRATPFLEIEVGDFAGESGFRGLRFAPDYDTSGEFYIIYSEPSEDTVLKRFKVSADPNVADPTSAEEILRIPQPHVVHNSSHMQFGPDGKFYLAVSDGGIQTNARDTSNILGSMIRIDLLSGPGYAIPDDNPFVGPGDPTDEIHSHGYRNPYVFDFDPLTGDLYVADVGAVTREEVSAGTLLDFAGRNMGWDRMEGTYCISGLTELCESGVLKEPIYEYARENGRCAIIGGILYRGMIPPLQGRFLFADYCSDEIWSLMWDGAEGVVDVIDHTVEMSPDIGEISNISAIQRDGNGEIVIVDRVDGEIFRVKHVPEPHFVALLSIGCLYLARLRSRRGIGKTSPVFRTADTRHSDN